MNFENQFSKYDKTEIQATILKEIDTSQILFVYFLCVKQRAYIYIYMRLLVNIS